MADISALVSRNAERWVNAKITRNDFSAVAKRLVANKLRYLAVQARTSVPWFIVAVIHEREASGRWDANIAQGDRWDTISVHVPRGRGPFKSWEDAAYDALVNCAPKAASWKDWAPGGAMTILEEYNGLGYAGGPAPTAGRYAGQKFPPQASPYIWSGTDQYKSGKYIADHDFDPNAVDQQLGCAGLILAMKALDPSIAFTGEASKPIPPPPDIHPPQQPPSGGFFTSIVQLILSLFKKG